MSQTVERATRILEALSESAHTVTQLAEMCGVHRTTMFRELQLLQRRGFVRKRQDGFFLLGLRLVELGQQAIGDVDLQAAAGPIARATQSRTGHTVHVSALLNDGIYYVDKVEDPAGIRMYSRVGAPVRPHCSAAGKAILAWLDQSYRDHVLADVDWQPFTATTVTTRAELDAELAVVHERGWAVDDGEFEDFVVCVAVPITTSAGVVGALSLTAVRVMSDLDDLAEHIPLLSSAAAQVGRTLDGGHHRKGQDAAEVTIAPGD